MNCIYFKRRSKNYKNYFYCSYYKKEIELNDCKNCIKKEYKERKPIKSYKPIKKVSNKRIIVSKETYNIVYAESKGRCALCKVVDNLQYHHILYRSERKDLIDDPSNGVMLCHQDFSINKCHRKVHDNKKKYQPILLDIKKSIKKEHSC